MDLPNVAEDRPPIEGAGSARGRRVPRRIGILARLVALVVLSIIPALSVQIYKEIEHRN